MSDTPQLGLNLILWIVMFGITFVLYYRTRSGVGLTLGFLLIFLANHWLASALYVLSWTPLHPPMFVAAGLQEAVFGMVAFSFGTLVVAPRILKRLNKVPLSTITKDKHSSRLVQLPTVSIYMIIGLAFYWTPLISVLLGNAFDLRTLMYALGQLSVLAACLFVYRSLQLRSRKTGFYALLFAALLPALGLVWSGFLSYGSTASIAIVLFFLTSGNFSLGRRKPLKLALLLMIGYVALSVLVTYMRDRTTIRETVWGGEEVSSRVDVISTTANAFEFFSLENPQHLTAIDTRLNGNYLVGRAVYNIETHLVTPANGSTFLNVLIAPIPRAMWPDKPIIAGGSELVSKYAGLRYNTATSSGVGPLFEAYINFGSLGVITLFLVLGVVMSVIDEQCRRALDLGHYRRFDLWFLPGLILMNPADSLAAAAGGMASVYLVARLVQWLMGAGLHGSAERSMLENAAQVPSAGQRKQQEGVLNSKSGHVR